MKPQSLFPSSEPAAPAEIKKPTTFRILASTREPGRCKSCGAAITWALTYPGRRRMPLTGNPIATSSDNVDGDAIETIPSSASHFASCPQAKKWSKRS